MFGAENVEHIFSGNNLIVGFSATHKKLVTSVAMLIGPHLAVWR